MSENQIKPKTRQEIRIMAGGGMKLAKIKKKLENAIKEGVSARQIDELADKLIKKVGGKPSFKIVPGYSWATCVNVNQGLVHGIPKTETVFKDKDVVSVDVGLFYKGFHTDTSFSVGINPDTETKRFLGVGKKTLRAAIKKALVGNRIFDLSKTIQENVEFKGYSPIRALVGHGIGRGLHEYPQIPCFVKGKRSETPGIPEGAVLAIEVMYTMGKPDVTIGEDGWTISVSDAKISALFEETVAVTRHGPLVLTAPDAVLSKANDIN